MRSGERIGIVGGGAAGLSAAYFLSRRGHTNVTVFEQEDRLGGKCFTVPFAGKAIEMGALELSPEFDDVLPMAREVDAPIQTEHGRRMANVRTGRVTPLDPFEGVPTRTVLMAVMRYYRKLWQHRHFINGPGMRNVPADLAMPMSQWLRKHRMEVMACYFECFLTVYGYGSLDELSAAYAMKYVDFINFNVGVQSKFLASLAAVLDRLASWRLLSRPRAERLKARVDSHSWPRILTHGFQDFWERIATKYLDGMIELNARVTHIEPGSAASSVVSVELADGRTFEFDRLLVTCPLDRRLQDLMPRMPERAKALFSEVLYTEYWTTACFVKDLPEGEYVLVPIPEVSENMPWGIFKAWDLPVAVFYTSFDKLDPAAPDSREIKGCEINNQEINQRVVEGIKSMLATIGAEVIEVDGREVLAQRLWKYFPHVPAERLESFFEEFHEIQGEGNIWYSGALLSYEISQRVIWHSKWLVAEWMSE